MHNFFDYISRSTLNNERKLKTLHKILKRGGIKNRIFIKSDDPYVFVYSTDSECDFQGVRIYPIANKMAFRIQNRVDTHPYGRPYLLDFEGMFNSFMAKEDADEMKAGKKVIEHFINSMKKFFKLSAGAQNEEDNIENLSTKTQGTDYSSQVFSKY
jgi:hypothetical protein